MKIAIAGDIGAERKRGILEVGQLAAYAIAVHIPKGLDAIYAERRAQGKGGRGNMVQNHADRRGIKLADARAEMVARSEEISDAIDEIEKTRQSAIVAINNAVTVADIAAIVEGAF